MYTWRCLTNASFGAYLHYIFTLYIYIYRTAIGTNSPLPGMERGEERGERGEGRGEERGERERENE